MTGWIYPQWLSNDMLLRSFSGAVFTDDAVITPLGGAVDPWFFDDQQGFGVDDVELSRDLSTVVGIAGQTTRSCASTARRSRRSARRTGTTSRSTPATRRSRALLRARRQVRVHDPGPGGGAMAYGTAEGVFVASIPAAARRRPRHAAGRGRPLPGLGPADVPPVSAFETVTPIPVRHRSGAAAKLKLTSPAPARSRSPLPARPRASPSSCAGARSAPRARPSRPRARSR